MSSETATDKIASIAGSALFRRIVVILIVVNAIIVGLDTYPQIHAAYGNILSLADRIILYVFSLELILRFLGSNPPVAFFRSGWNLFDLVIVGVSFLPSSEFFTVARLFRILRALRTVSVLPDLQKVVTALLRSLPSLGHILILLALLMYVYAAIGTSLFGEIAPKYFGSLHQSVLTLFSVITLEGWITVMDEVLPQMPGAWIYFVSFILFATFVAMNFFVGVIVNNLRLWRSKSATTLPRFGRRSRAWRRNSNQVKPAHPTNAREVISSILNARPSSLAALRNEITAAVLCAVDVASDH